MYQLLAVQLGQQPVEHLATARRIEPRPAGHDVDADQIREYGVYIEIVERRQLGGLLPADQVDFALLLHEVGLVVHRRDDRVDEGKFAPQAEIGGRAALQLFGHVASPHDHLLDRARGGAGGQCGHNVAQRAVEFGPGTQEAAPRAAAGVVVGGEERRLEAARRIDLLGLLAFGVGVGLHHAGDALRQTRRRLELLLELLAREVAQRVVGRAARPQREDVFAVVVAVEQTHLRGVRRADPVENLLDDALRIKALGVGVERILAQSGDQTVIVPRGHDYSALKRSSDTLSRRYSPSSASKSASENEM